MALREFGRRHAARQPPDRAGVAREVAAAAQPVAFQRDPIGPEIAEIGDDHRDAADGSGLDGGAVILALLAEEEDVRDALGVEEAGDEIRPALRPVAIVEGWRRACRIPPE